MKKTQNNGATQSLRQPADNVIAMCKKANTPRERLNERLTRNYTEPSVKELMFEVEMTREERIYFAMAMVFGFVLCSGLWVVALINLGVIV